MRRFLKYSNSGKRRHADNVVDLTEARDGGRVTSHDTEFERTMETAERIMKKRRMVFRELA